ncbi:odorant receptor 13a-like isoform X1 [Neodiprion fabricii]|uniref:odorant receptor 13a-like isoform X1 n=2 Tax=Neodiprion fabricii TaxID=2872261 RepID=UPI001ED8CEA2|nr:odorant receptor 13a-like isoform X1 [Neodiprion fabricii]
MTRSRMTIDTIEKTKSSLINGETMDVTSYVSLNRVILKLTGLHPKSLPRTLTVAFFMLLIVVPQIQQIYYSSNLNIILETSSVLLTIILALLKMIVWTSRRREIDDLITFMFGEYWNIAKQRSETGASCFLGYASFAKKFTRCYGFLVFNALLVFYTSPLVQIYILDTEDSSNGTRPLFFPGIYPEGWTEPPFYQLALLSQVVATITCATVILAIDTLIASTLFHTSGHFRILQINLQRLGDDTIDMIDKRKNAESLTITARQKLATCIKHHQIILRFSKNVDHLFSPIMLCQVLASNLIICLVGLQVTLTPTDRSKGAKYFSYLMMALFQLILFCFPGDGLISQSLAVSDAAYATKWFKLSKRLKTDVRLIILRGQKPAKITAGKFNVMCLEHLATVLSASMSYFTVLRSLS